MKKLLFFLLSFFVSLHAGESQQIQRRVETPPAVIVIFGATGDLTARKVLPAIYHLAEEGNLSANTAVVGVGRRDYTSLKFRELMKEGMQTSDEGWEAFEQKLFYHRVDFDAEEGYEELNILLENIDKQWGTKGNRIFYLATHSDAFAAIIQKLRENGLVYDTEIDKKWSRVVLEKPFGRDLDSALQLQTEISKFLDESQIYRIDHYLGKPAVQNLFALRFINTMFEPLWNNRYIDHVQITISEEIGIGTRSHFWEETGLLRDIFQNHMMQLLSIVAMEPPSSLQAKEVHAEKVKLLKAVRPFPVNEIDRSVVRGQYGPGDSKENPVPGYRQEKGVPDDSVVETFAAAKLWIDNERWRGVPFYLRSGKRLDAQTAEIVLSFKNSPNELYRAHLGCGNLRSCLFPFGFAFALASWQEDCVELHALPNKKMQGTNSHNVSGRGIFIRIQPHAGVFFRMASDVSGLETRSGSVLMGYELDSHLPEAYEKLIFECLRGDKSAFVAVEEQLAAWKILTPVLEHWQNSPRLTIPQYAAGSQGPNEAEALIVEDGRKWILTGAVKR